MSYADTAQVAATSAWGALGTSPLAFTNTSGFGCQVFRKASGSPAAADVGTPVDAGQRYENGTTGEVLYVRLMPGPPDETPGANLTVDQWT